jgi:hypothetical protein
LRHYLAGPMTGLPQYNFPAFRIAAERLRYRGLDVVSAHEVDHGETEEDRGDKPHNEYMRGDLIHMLEKGCTAIILLPGWQRSKGALIEFQIAVGLDMEIFEYCRHMDCDHLIHRVR